MNVFQISLLYRVIERDRVLTKFSVRIAWLNHALARESDAINDAIARDASLANEDAGVDHVSNFSKNNGHCPIMRLFHKYFQHRL